MTAACIERQTTINNHPTAQLRDKDHCVGVPYYANMAPPSDSAALRDVPRNAKGATPKIMQPS